MAIAKGKFEAELNAIDKLLRSFDFLNDRNYNISNDFDPSVYRNKSYLDNWRSLIAENIYTFMLSDNSILKFKYADSDHKLSFQFYECPFICQTYKEFLIDNELEEDHEDKIFTDYYENYLQQCIPKENPVMIRYDLDPSSYFEGLHPISHIHVGHKNQIRLGINKILNPKSFMSFILRQNYPTIWKSIITTENEWKNYFLKEKSNLIDIDAHMWKNLDLAEFHLE